MQPHDCSRCHSARPQASLPHLISPENEVQYVVSAPRCQILGGLLDSDAIHGLAWLLHLKDVPHPAGGMLGPFGDVQRGHGGPRKGKARAQHI